MGRGLQCFNFSVTSARANIVPIGRLFRRPIFGRSMTMKFPTIDLSAIPGMDTATGIFGSVTQAAATFDDSVVAIMVVVYETTVPPTGLG